MNLATQDVLLLNCFFAASSYLPRNAVGEIIPVLFETRIVVPDSRNGAVKSTAASRSALTLRDVRTMSNFLFTNSETRPFQ